MASPTVLVILAFAFLAAAAPSSVRMQRVHHLNQPASAWKQRVIYQVLTDRFAQSGSDEDQCGNLRDYCGGTWQGIANKLNYIKGLGADAIWISPIPVNTDGGYHGYWAQDITQVNPHFGSADDLKNLVNAAHQQGIWVMLDVVANHMGNQANQNDFSQFVPFNSSDHYHPYCIINNWSNQTEVEFCRLAGLPDLSQENSYVQNTLTSWVRSTVATYGFDGIRIDTIPEVPAAFWSQYSAAAGVFTIGEVDNGDPAYVGPYQGPLDATLNYPMYWALRNALQEHQGMTKIQSQWAAVKNDFKDPSLLGLFLDNHDNPRFLNINSDQAALLNGLAYILFGEGIPIIYYGTEQAFNGGNDPDNREDLWRSGYQTNSFLYTSIATLTSFRKTLPQAFYDASLVESSIDDSVYSFIRDKVLVMMTGQGEQTRTISGLPYSDGTVVQNILNTQQQYTVNNGQVSLTTSNGHPLVLYPTSP